MRIHPIWITGDVKQAFLQISIAPQDRNALRFLYISPESGKELHLRFTLLPFGGGPSPFGMGAVFWRLWDENENEFPETVKKMQWDTYVDDVNQGGHDKQELCKLREEAVEIFKRGKFKLRKWQSDEETLNDCDLPNETKLLGLNWDKRKDMLTINKEMYKPVPKRDILHTVDIERCLDKVLPPEFQNQWKKWIHGLDTVCIPRSITSVLQPIKYIDLHMFGDSSQIASATTGIAVISQLSKETSGIVASWARIA